MTLMTNPLAARFNDIDWVKVGEMIGCSARRLDDRSWRFTSKPGVYSKQSREFEVTDNGGEFNLYEVHRVMLPKGSPMSLPLEQIGPPPSAIDHASRIIALIHGTPESIDWNERL